MKGHISENFTWEEFEYSDKAIALGIENIIPDEGIAAQIRSLVLSVLQPLRTACGHALHLNSGYRCAKLNKAVKGAKNSQHTKGQAADIAASDPLALAKLVIELNLPFDQMILYGDFVHLSHKAEGPQRGQILYGESYTGQKLNQ